MSKQTVLKPIAVILYAVLTFVMVAATIISQTKGLAFATSHIYSAWWFVGLWAVLGTVGGAHIICRRLYRRPVLFILHLSLAAIIYGMVLSTFSGSKGELHLRLHEPVDAYADASSPDSMLQFPFVVELKEFDVRYYDGTVSTRDFWGSLHFVAPDNEEKTATAAINDVIYFKCYIFSLISCDADKRGIRMAVYHDPFGFLVTVIGQLGLFFSLLMLLFSPRYGFRPMLRILTSHVEEFERKNPQWHFSFSLPLVPPFMQPFLLPFALSLLLLGTSSCSGSAEEQPRNVPQKYADSFGDLYAYYNGRICPMRTAAVDFVLKVNGNMTYKGLSPEQVLFSSTIFGSEWMSEKFIKVSPAVARLLGKGREGYVAYRDFMVDGTYALDSLVADIRQGKPVPNASDIIVADERVHLFRLNVAGRVVAVFPYTFTDERGRRHLHWASTRGKMPPQVEGEQAQFVYGAMNMVSEAAFSKNYQLLERYIDRIKQYQRQVAGDYLPSDLRFYAEKLYSHTYGKRPLAVALIVIGVLSFVYFIFRWSNDRGVDVRVKRVLWWFMAAVAFFAFMLFVLRGIITLHVPLSTGYEIMNFMALATLCIILSNSRRFAITLPFGFIVAGLCMLVSVMGTNNPQITALQPMLSSPLMSLHVCLVMIAFSIMTLMFLNSLCAFLLPKLAHALALATRVSLYPAVAFLCIGMMIGTIWTNLAFGRYWDWDMREVWTLVTLMVYAVPLHRKLDAKLSDPIWLHSYVALAYVSVLMSYIGANYFIGGIAYNYGV